MRLRRFQYVIQVIARLFSAKTLCENGKIWCGNGKMVVYFRRVHALFPVFRLPMWRNGGAIAAVGGVVAAEIHCVAAVA